MRKNSKIWKKILSSNFYWLLCADFLCLARFLFWENCWPHCPQGYLTPSWTALLCSARLLFRVKCWPHCPQGYLTPSCTALLCSARLLFWVNCWPHCPQGYLTPLCTALLCFKTFPFDENSFPHCSQEFLIPSQENIFYIPAFDLNWKIKTISHINSKILSLRIISVLMLYAILKKETGSKDTGRSLIIICYLPRQITSKPCNLQPPQKTPPLLLTCTIWSI